MVEYSAAESADFRRRKKEEAIEILRNCDDPEDAFVWFGNHEYLDFFINNIDIFRHRAFYEEGLFRALTMVSMQETSTNYSVDLILFLLNQADRDKLRACGDVLPTEHPIEVFRGITNSKNTRSIRRPFWTLKPETAAWFAAVCGRRDHFFPRADTPATTPAVFRMMAPPEAIYFYTNRRGENEVVLDPRLCGPAKRLAILPTPIQPKSTENEEM